MTAYWKLTYADGTTEEVSTGYAEEREVHVEYFESVNGSELVSVECQGFDVY